MPKPLHTYILLVLTLLLVLLVESIIWSFINHSFLSFDVLKVFLPLQGANGTRTKHSAGRQLSPPTQAPWLSDSACHKCPLQNVIDCKKDSYWLEAGILAKRLSSYQFWTPVGWSFKQKHKTDVHKQYNFTSLQLRSLFWIFWRAAACGSNYDCQRCKGHSSAKTRWVPRFLIPLDHKDI